MLHHAGVLGPPNNPILARIHSQRLDRLPEDIGYDLDVALLTPGFPTAWWAAALDKSFIVIKKRRLSIDPGLQSKAIENWNSITREDCIALSKLGRSLPVPVLIQIMADKQAGATHADIKATYGCTNRVLRSLAEHPPLSHPTMPDWFRSMIPGA